MKCIPLAIAALCLSGCEGYHDPSEIPTAPVEAPEFPRFTAEYQGRFRGGYNNNQRDIFILTDTKTGAEYLAVTGCGTTEMHTEHHGKTTSTREE